TARPSDCDAAGEGSVISRPPISTLPESGSAEPAATAISVDFPAPFSPTRACTSPSATSKLTPLRATTPGYVLTTSDRRRAARADMSYGFPYFAIVAKVSLFDA